MQGAAKAFYANRRILCDKRASIAQRLKLFNSVVTTVACFAAEHRPMYVEDLRAMDIEFRRLVRQIVGPPPQVDWESPWHDILHLWNERARSFVANAGIRTWAEQCVHQYWSFAEYVQQLPDTRCITRVLNWSPRGRRRAGRPRLTWSHKLEAFGRVIGSQWRSWSLDVFQQRASAFQDFCRHS